MEETRLIYRLKVDPKPMVMGILNLTPDSFSDGGILLSQDDVLSKAGDMLDSGAEILDLGGESTRPGAPRVSLEDERQRVMPALCALRKAYPDAFLSIDTSKPELMIEAIAEGVDLVNDVCGLNKPGAIDAVANSSVALCLMHMQGEPGSMQQNPQYNDVVSDVANFLQDRVDACCTQGVAAERIILDPGFGFGKTLQHNIQILKSMPSFVELGYPVLAGLSRKRMIGSMTGVDVADQRVIGSVVAAFMAVQQGARIVRVHDVKATTEAMSFHSALDGLDVFE